MLHCIDTHKDEFFKVEENDIIKFISIKNLKEEIDENLSFLSTDERYKKIKNIIENNNFLFVNLDIYKTDSFNEITQQLSENDLVVDTLYLSNLEIDIIKIANLKFLNYLKNPNVIFSGDLCNQQLTKKEFL